jgi:hypothetical protein
MNKKLILAIAATAVGAILFILFGRGALSPQKTLFLSQPVATNFRYPAQLSANEAYYFNGSAFLSFNLSDQSSKPLTPIYLLPNVLDVQWSKTGALFKASSYSALDQLKPLLEQKKLPTNSSYWWSVNFATGEIKLVGSPRGPSSDGAASDGTIVSSAIWSVDGQSYYYVQTELLRSQSYINTVFNNTLNGINKALAKIDGNNLTWANQNQVIFRVDSGDKHSLNLFDASARTTQVLLDTFNGPSFINSSGNTALTIPVKIKEAQEVVSEASGPLHITSLDDPSSTKLVSKRFTGTAIWSRHSDAWAAIELDPDGKLSGYADDGSGKIFALRFKGEGSRAKLTHPKSIGYEDDQLLLIDASNNAYLASETELNLKPVRLFKPSEWDYSGSEALMKHGLTSAQLKGLKYAIYQYTLASGQNPERVKITNVEIEPYNRKDPTGKAIANFNITLDKTTYRAKMEYFDLTLIQLYMYNQKTNTPVYDSKTVTSRNTE